MNHPFNLEYFADLFELEKPLNDIDFYEKLDNSSLKFGYFMADNKYFLLIYGRKDIIRNKDPILNSIKINQEIYRNKKPFETLKRRFKQCLKIRKSASELKDLKSNLRVDFWKFAGIGIRTRMSNAFENYMCWLDTEEYISELGVMRLKVEKLEDELKMLKGRRSDPSEDAPLTFKNYKSVSLEELEEIILRGFEVKKMNRLRLPEFYEGEGEFSLYKWKGFKMKFNTVRRKDLYKNIRVNLI